jgi:NHLM bacteriocin system ABC transporter peptidase/ATP-binding protein
MTMPAIFSALRDAIAARLGSARAGADRARRAVTVNVQQADISESGVACLAMVLAYHGRYVPLDELRQTCGAQRNGSRPSNLIRGAQRYGVIGKGFKADLAKLKTMPMPLVAFVNFNHFVVLEGIDTAQDKVYLNDPADSPRTLSVAAFAEQFTGIVLAFQPGPNFVRRAPPTNAIASLLRRARTSTAGLVYILLSSLLLLVPSLAVPAFSRAFVDELLVEGQSDWLWWLVGAMVAVSFMVAGLSYFQQSAIIRLRMKLATSWAAQMMWQLLRMPMSFFANYNAGDIGNRINSIERASQIVASDLTTVAINLSASAVFATVMIQYDWLLTLIGIGFASINIIVFLFSSRYLQQAHKRNAKDLAEADGTLVQGIQMIEALRASGTETVFSTRWCGHFAKAIDAEQRIGRLQAVINGLPAFVALLAGVCILVVGGLRVMDGAITVGMLIAFQGLLNNFSAPIGNAVEVGSDLQEAESVVKRMEQIIAADPDEEFSLPALADVPPAMLSIGGTLKLDAVSFGFSPLDPPMIEGLSLDVPAGAVIALVGVSGSGKSTIARMLVGLNRPWSGSILVDGHPLGALPREILRSKLACVESEPALFEGSVSDNITLWDKTIGEQSVVRAAKDACIHEAIAARPGGYGCTVREEGRNFSIGEAQRLELARALARSPSVLILDEALSMVDAATEQEILERIRRRGCTTIVVSQRLTSIRECDEIVVIDKAAIVQRGRHEDLVAENELYRSLVVGSAA